MKKKIYEKPSVEVVVLQQQTHLLQVSSIEVNANMNTKWDEEEL